MSDRYRVSTVDDLATAPIAGQARWHTIRSTLGIASFGINAWTATEDGQQVIGEHDEANEGATAHEELYLVLTGNATFTLDGEEVDAPAGTVVHVPDPSVKRGAKAARGTSILVVGAKPGEAFTPSPWERSAEALRYWPTEEWDRAIEVLERHLAETPGNAGTLYNLACAHARAGSRSTRSTGFASPWRSRIASASSPGPTRISLRFVTIRASRRPRAERQRRPPGSLTPAASARNAGTGS